MNYQEIFPKILEKSYKIYKDVSLNEIPLVQKKEKVIGLPFIDSLYLKDILEKSIKKLIKKNKIIEIKLSEFNSNIHKLRKKLLDSGFKENKVRGHIISKLTNKEDFWKRFHKHTRNDIRKAEKSSLKIKKINSLSELKKFYKIYFKHMKQFGTPQHSFKFFKNCFKMMENSFFGLNCYFKNKVIGSIILFIEKDYVYVSFNVSDSKFRKYRPNDLLYWKSILWCMEKKFKYLDLGQIDFNPKRGTREDSLLRFKKKWLGKEYERVYFTKGFKYDFLNKKSLKKLRKVWSLLPSPIIKLIGPKINSKLGK